jgi:hypothetical protein
MPKAKTALSPTVRQRAKSAAQAFVRWKAQQDAARDAENEADIIYAPDEIACANPFKVRLVGARREM